MTSAGANTWSVPLEINNLEAKIGSGGGGGGVSSVTAGNSNIVIGGTSANPTISGTLIALTSNVNTSNFAFSGNTGSSPSFVLTGSENFRVITSDLTPQILVNTSGVALGSTGSGYTVTAPTPPVANNSTQVATTQFIHRSQVNTLNFFKPLFPSLVKQSIIYHNPSTTITATTIDAQLDGLPDYPQYISYGATNPNLYVIVGEGTNDQIAVSTDGINYQGLGFIFGTTAGNFGAGVAYSGSLNRWVAVGRGNPTIVYSTTGYNWTNVVDSTTTLAEGTSVFWTGTRFLAGGIGSPNTIAYSDNGTTWFGVGTSIFTTRCNGFATNGELIVAVGIGTNHIAYSYDGGLTFTGLGAIISNAGGTSVIWTGKRFIATFDDSTGVGNTVGYSFNGIDWFGQGMIFTSYGYGSASNNVAQVVVGAGSGGIISASFNGGENWNSVSSAGLDGLGFSVIWSGSLWIATGSGISNVVYSTDSNSWFNAVQPIDLSVRGVAFNYDRSHRVTFPVNRIVACGSGGNSLAYSNNGGRNWNNLNTVLNTTANGLAVISVAPEFGNYVYVAVGAGTSPAHSVAISNDGVNWRKGANPFTTNGNAVLYGNRWVACGSGTSQIAHSNDAITWTTQPNVVFTIGRGLAYNGTNMWVCVGSGAGNTISHSTAGTLFIGQGSTIFTSAGRGVVWGTDKFVAVGSGGTSIAYSSNGTIWNPVAGSTALCSAFNAIAYNGSLFLAGGQNGLGTTNIASSPDGITWTGLATVNFNAILGIAWVGDKWVITGSGSFSGVPNRIAYSTNSAGTEWVYLGNQQFATTGQSAVWNGSLGTPVVPASSIVLNSTNGKKLDIVPAPYGNSGYNNITMTVKT